MDPPLWTDIAQTGLLLAEVVLLGVAVKVVYPHLKPAKTLREDQARPFVVIDLDSPHQPFVDIVVKNIGTTMARDVGFTFTPDAESTIDGISLGKLKMFSERISTLPPGKEIRTLFDRSDGRFASDLPDTYAVTVEYFSANAKTKYVDTIDLDFGLYWNRMTISRKGVHHVHEELKKMREQMEMWSPSIGGGLLTRTPHDVEKMNEELIRESDERHAGYEMHQAEAEVAEAADSTEDEA